MAQVRAQPSSETLRPESMAVYPRTLTNIGGRLYFSANDRVNGDELWSSNGTVMGTVLEADINAGPRGSFPNFISGVPGRLIVVANDEIVGQELFVQVPPFFPATSLAAEGEFASSPAPLVESNSLASDLAIVDLTSQDVWKHHRQRARTR